MATAPVTSTTPPEFEDSVESRILDAAVVQFEQVGVKKTTIEDIARRAGVDRVTVYRRVGSRDDVVSAVFTREIGLVMAELAAIPDRHDNFSDLIADLLATVIGRWRRHPLVNRILLLEPERVLPRLTTESAPTIALSIATVESIVRTAVAKGLLPDPPDLTARAEIASRIVHSLILAPVGAVTLETDEQIGEFARTYLVPVFSSDAVGRTRQPKK